MRGERKGAASPGRYTGAWARDGVRGTFWGRGRLLGWGRSGGGSEDGVGKGQSIARQSPPLLLPSLLSPLALVSVLRAAEELKPNRAMLWHVGAVPAERDPKAGPCAGGRERGSHLGSPGDLVLSLQESSIFPSKQGKAQRSRFHKSPVLSKRHAVSAAPF